MLLTRACREEDSEPQAERLGDEELSSQSESSDPDDEDGEEVPPVRSYAALMHSLASEAVSASKRRKLERVPGPKAVEARDHRMEQAEADVHEVDDAAEPDEGPETAAHSPLEDEDDLEDASDPFVTHFADPAGNVLSRRLESLQRNLSSLQPISLPTIGKAVVSVPDEGSSKSTASWAIVSGPKELKLKQKLTRVVAEQRSSRTLHLQLSRRHVLRAKSLERGKLTATDLSTRYQPHF
jgi:U3 small nucleolar RNA-associated protein 25